MAEDVAGVVEKEETKANAAAGVEDETEEGGEIDEGGLTCKLRDAYYQSFNGLPPWLFKKVASGSFDSTVHFGNWQ